MLAKRKLETSLKDEGDKTKLKNKLKKVTNEVTSEEIDDLDDENSGDEKISKDDIDYNMPKPGPHAKVDYYYSLDAPKLKVEVVKITFVLNLKGW